MTTGSATPEAARAEPGSFLLLFMWQTPPWLVVILCALVGFALSYF